MQTPTQNYKGLKKAQTVRLEKEIQKKKRFNIFAQIIKAVTTKRTEQYE